MPRCPRLLACCLFICVTISSVHTFSEEWTRFRGPNGTGVSDAAGIPTSWTADDYAWKAELPGIGHSSPVVWGEKLFILSADPKSATRYVLCINTKSGKELWRREFESSSHHLHARNSFASCTPAVDENRIYFAWGTPKQTTLKSLSHDGEDAWEVNLPPFVGMHGFATSPIIYKDTVLLNMMSLESPAQVKKAQDYDEPGFALLMAFDRNSGKTRWAAQRDSEVAAYSVPCIYTDADGRDQIICCASGHDVFSLNPDDGKVNWSVESFSMRTVSSPVIAGGLIFGTTGSGGGGNYVVAVDPPASSTGEAKIKYQVKEAAPYVPTPVAHGDLLFLWSDKGVVTCIDAPSGKQHWQKRVGGNFSGSPVRVRDALYCIDEEGTVAVLAASKDYQLHGKFPLGQPSRATPAVAGGKMFLRTESQLVAIGK